MITINATGDTTIHTAGKYCTEDILVKAPSGDSAISGEDGLITRTTTQYTNSKASTIGSWAFYASPNLKTVNFTACTEIMYRAFGNCTALTSVSFPACTQIGGYAFFSAGIKTAYFPKCTNILALAFGSCNSLSAIDLPACVSISDSFSKCSNLKTVSLSACTYIGWGAFASCYRLTSLHLLGSSVCKLNASNAFTSSPIGGYSTYAGTYGSIYVPASLLASYKAATNWTYFSSRFVGV